MLGCVAHFEIVKKLGEGGMGVVYQARDRSLDRFVALKFLNAKLGNLDAEIARFELEARAISALNHPNIATIHGIEQSDAHRFLVLEYLPGGTLSARLAQLRSLGTELSVEQALDYAIQIAQGLKHAHRHGVVHRDVKASNVMFTEEGLLKITDFGIAQLNQSLHGDEVIGTPRSMSPEQALGKAVDHRTDVFSLGVLLYELLGGEKPFRAPKGVELTHQIVYEDPPPLDSLRDGIPIALQRIVNRALAKNPDDRYSSVAELLVDLRAVRQSPADLVTGTSEETVTLQARPRRSSKPAIAVAVLLPILIIAIGAAIPSVRQAVLQRLNLLPLPSEKRIAVLPFSAEAANQAFSDGLNDIVSYKLAQLEQFHGSLLVVAASEINSKSVKTASGARQTFGANLAITGSVLRTGEQIQAMVSLVDTSRLVHLRSATVESRISEITTFRDRVISKVAAMLDLELTAAAQRTLRAGETSVSNAYADYVEGRGYLQRFDRAGNLAKAISLFQSALAKDPKYALAYAGLADSFLQKYKETKETPSIDEAFVNCTHAIELNGELEPVHVTMGLVKSAKGDYEGAEAEFRHVLDLNPINPEALRGLAQTYASCSRVKLAEQAYKKAIELRPNDWRSINFLGAFYFNQNCYALAEPYFRKVEQVTPDNYLAYTNLGATYAALGYNEKAIEMFSKSLTLNPSPALTYSNLGMAYGFVGRNKDAAESHRKATQRSPETESYWGNLGHALRWVPELSAQAPDAFRRAIELGERQVSVDPRDPKVHARLAEYWAILGQKRQSLAAIARALAIAPRNGYVQYRAALVYEQTGDRKRAAAALKSAILTGYSLQEIEAAAPLKPLRDNPEYKKLVSSQMAMNLNPCTLQR